MKRKIIKSYFGNVLLLKDVCPQCEKESIIVNDKFTCCSMKANIEDVKRFNKRRESLSKSQRTMPALAVRRHILNHQNHQCLYCGGSLRGKKRINYDHFIPFAYSATNSKLNFVASCRKCNAIKSSLIFNSIQEARIHILIQRSKKDLPNYDYYGGSYELRKL